MIARIEAMLRPGFARRAEAVAIVDGDESVCYGDLDARSDRIAAVLRQTGLRADDRVCLLAPKSINAIAAVLGVLKAGGIYVPLDCKSPPARLSPMIRTCAPCWLIVDGAERDLATACRDELESGSIDGIFTLDAAFGLTPESACVARPARASGGGDFRNLAYILFTSGSTGRPKGVPIPHQNVVDYVDWANAHFGVRPGDRISSHAPLHFDMSVWDMFGTFAAGAALCLVPPEASLTPNLTAEFIRKSRLTQWYSVPSVLTAMFSRDVLQQGDFPDLQRVIWGGEALSVVALRYWMQRLPHAVFTNVYGPTEATVNSTSYTIAEAPAETAMAVPIGTPIPGRKLIILDESGREAKPGEIGQLFIGGTGLSPGYWRDPDQTARAFRAMPERSPSRWYRTGDLARVDADGLYHFHGRSDRQIKSRGYRIELDDVGAALGQLAPLAESAVVAIPVGGLEGMRICAACVAAPDANCTPAELKAALSQTLPSYMIPRRWLLLEAMPRNVNGKVDLPRVAQLFANG